MRRVLPCCALLLACSAPESANHAMRCSPTQSCPDELVCYRGFCVDDELDPSTGSPVSNQPGVAVVEAGTPLTASDDAGASSPNGGGDTPAHGDSAASGTAGASGADSASSGTSPTESSSGSPSSGSTSSGSITSGSPSSGSPAASGSATSGSATSGSTSSGSTSSGTSPSGSSSGSTSSGSGSATPGSATGASSTHDAAVGVTPSTPQQLDAGSSSTRPGDATVAIPSPTPTPTPAPTPTPRPTAPVADAGAANGPCTVPCASASYDEKKCNQCVKDTYGESPAKLCKGGADDDAPLISLMLDPICVSLCLGAARNSPTCIGLFSKHGPVLGGEQP
jgi:hypothetical protein